MKITPEDYILWAADNVEKLHICDVFNILNCSPAKKRAKTAKYITKKHPDLANEVHTSIEIISPPQTHSPATLNLQP